LVNISEQLMKQIPLVGDALGSQVPEVVMGVTDRKLRLQGRFLGQTQPVVTSEGHNGTSIAVFGDPMT